MNQNVELVCFCARFRLEIGIMKKNHLKKGASSPNMEADFVLET
jgi:hypothetical protein